MWCNQCGTQLEQDAKFCHNCGAPCDQETQDKTKGSSMEAGSSEAVEHCLKCGAPLFPDEAFCNQCGAPVTRAATEAQAYRCPKCNTEYLPGAQFCSVCGTPLGQRERYAPESQIFNSLKRVPGFISSYFRQPITTTMAVVEEPGLLLPAILFIIYVIACGIQLYSLLQFICDAFQGLMQSMFGMFAATFLLEAPLLTSLVFGVLYGTLFILLLSAVFFGCSKILHEDCSWSVIIRTTVAQSIAPTLILLVSALATMLSPWLAILLFFLAQITWIVLMVLGLSTLSDRSQSGRFWFPLIALLFVAFLIFNIIVYKTSWQLTKNISISYDGESMTISEIMESEGITEAEDFFEAVLGDLF